MADYCNDISTLLTGITSSIYLHNLPTTPTDFIGVSYADDNRIAPEHTMGRQKPLFRVEYIEVLVCNSSAATAFSWLETIQDTLDGKTNFTINTRHYVSCKQTSGVIPMGRDKQDRFISYVLFEVLVTVT